MSWRPAQVSHGEEDYPLRNAGNGDRLSPPIICCWRCQAASNRWVGAAAVCRSYTAGNRLKHNVIGIVQLPSFALLCAGHRC